MWGLVLRQKARPDCVRGPRLRVTLTPIARLRAVQDPVQRVCGPKRPALKTCNEGLFM